MKPKRQRRKTKDINNRTDTILKRALLWIKLIPPFFQFLASVVTILGLVIVILNFHEFNVLYQKTVKTDNYWQGILSSLNVEADIGIFREKLGSPTIVNDQTNDEKTYVFINSKFYVDVLTDKVGKVIIYTVTTRDKTFNPTLGTYIYKVTLGKTTFQNLQDQPFATGLSIGFHDYYYEEFFYYGNPGNYLTYVYSINDSGYYSYTGFNLLSDQHGFREINDVLSHNCSDKSSPYYNFPTLWESPSSKVGLKQWVSFRKNAVINQVSFISPNPSFLCDDYLGSPYKTIPMFGPNINQVRLFEQNGAKQ